MGDLMSGLGEDRFPIAALIRQEPAPPNTHSYLVGIVVIRELEFNRRSNCYVSKWLGIRSDL